ncbi:MAG: helix-turn-helix domain-containing protein [Planctomycetota bacterium]
MKNPLLSPKQVADALGVSQSSVRRWCDQGKLASTRTAGGHRKFAVEAVIRFAREIGADIQNPELLGNPVLQRGGLSASSVQDFVHALRNDKPAFCVQALVAAFNAPTKVSSLLDELVGPAMQQIGALWESGEISVDQERRSCQIVLAALAELEDLLPKPAGGAPLAIGGTPAGDFAQIGTRMCELVLKANGWNARQLGAGLPPQYLAAACRRENPDLLWISAIHLLDPQAFATEYRDRLGPLINQGLRVALGGREISPHLRACLPHAFYGESMTQLDAYCRGVPKRQVEAPIPSLLAEPQNTPSAPLNS